jgi:hypothetical protein
MGTLTLVVIAFVVGIVFVITAQLIGIGGGFPTRRPPQSNPVFTALLGGREERTAAALVAIVDAEQTKARFIRRIKVQVHRECSNATLGAEERMPHSQLK